MDTIADCRQIVKGIINEYSGFFDSESEVQSQVIFDLENDCYMLLSIGWFQGRRIHDCVIHMDIIDGQVWIQANNTDRSIAEELVAAGIPPQLIVLGLQPPEVRAYTAYGVANSIHSQELLQVS
ncbi:MAG: XisI protein [Microcoleus sp. PH2017_10_PVI_O_A]|uniref:XisI protein n=1 Tax=unclassified Microcoleus TaxID=2642155 RepID=UPI001D34C18A|nr:MULTISPECIES: XisI protein [unclassified Microcoleus]TAE80240.1 MAG: XisI protein [Oscillatoriales cyanobacterium]MCC3406490.1 XisI protein [Microcoleus sp. PH2017_10_PVI_O_A]MCC3460513.1 XisI protein [Microcoleus sp. PH2017_11_PCY_U_A]MCC3478930.1 XisI protein [Microcoleus sp. PH2017_12_PCY_D_A]MCC3559865.1 XisI protein [Microcoleus sp. PH2017_27_LUM_O_A]